MPAPNPTHHQMFMNAVPAVSGDALATSNPQSLVCPACLDLDYTNCLRFPPQLLSANSRESPQARYWLTGFRQLQNAATHGCSTCQVLQTGIDHFWSNDKAPGGQRTRSWTQITKPFERVICLALQPGSSLVLLRVLLFLDIADKSYIYSLTVRDSTSRIEFYRDDE